jgi:hypothetical protein
VACPRIQSQQRSTHVLEHAQTHHGIPLHPKDARNSTLTFDSARNSRARHPTRPSKCTISSTVRARSAAPTAHNHRFVPYACFQHAQRHRGIPVHSKGARIGSTFQTMRATLGGTRPTARPSKCVISCVTWARSGAPTHTATETPRARALNTQRRITGSLSTQRCVLIETCGTSKLLAERPTPRPSKCITLSVTRVMSGASTHTRTESLRMLTLAPPKRLPGDSFALKKCSQHMRHLQERAHLLDERATSRSSKCIISSAAPVLSSVLMHTPVGTLRTRALAMPKACREPFAVIYGARNGTSHSARTRV